MVSSMSPELIGILAVGVALGGVIIAGQRRLEGRHERGMAALESRLESRMSALESGMAALESRLEKRISALESRLESRMSALESRVEAVEHGLADLRERMARLEGLLDGLREAIVGRARQNAAE